MKRIFYFIVFLLIGNICAAQVGVGTVTPEAQLEIRSSNQATPANNDGILIPKVDEFSAVNPTAAKDGMLIYATGSGSVSKGFYYWNNAGTSWVELTTGGQGDDWYEESTSNVPNNISDDIYTFGNVAIGQNTADFPLDISENALTRTINLNNSLTSGIISGVFNNVSGAMTTSDAQRGVYNLLAGTGNNPHFGVYNNSNGSGSGVHYGTYNSLIGDGTGEHFGSYNTLTTASDGVQYGVRAIINSSGDGVQYGMRSSVTSTGNGQVSGLQSFTASAAVGATQYGIVNQFLSGTGVSSYGIYNDITTSSTSTKYGLYNNFDINTGLVGGDLVGTFHNFNGITSSLTATGTQIIIPSTISGISYGVRSDVFNANSFAIYGAASTSVNSYAGYFDGDMLGTNRLELTDAGIDASGTTGTGILELGGNLRLDANEIITNTGGTLFLQWDNGGNVRADGNTFFLDGTNNRIGLGNNAPAYTLEVSGPVMMEDVAVPTATAGHSGIYSSAGEVNAIDAAGNSTVISPHHFSLMEPSDEMAWSFYSRNERIGKEVNVDMMRVVKTVEKISGEKLLYKADIDGSLISSAEKEKSLVSIVEQQQETISQLQNEIQDLKYKVEAILKQKQNY